MKRTILLVSLILISVIATSQIFADVTVYSSRKAHLIEPLFREFTSQTGVKINFITGKGNALIERIKLEGRNTKADIFMTVDAGNLWYAGTQGILKRTYSNIINTNIPSHLRDLKGLWTGLSVRARTIVYNTNKVNPKELSTYDALASRKWRGRLCLRTSKKIYTKSLVASLLNHLGARRTAKVIKGWVNNLAATPNVKDSHIMDAILSGQCDVGIVNTYYYARLMAKKPNVPLKLFWANQNTTGTHVNITGAGITKYSKNKKQATMLLEWLTKDKAQNLYAQLNKEYPANPKIKSGPIVSSWGAFKQDNMNLSIAGKLQAKAVRLMQRNGYK